MRSALTSAITSVKVPITSRTNRVRRFVKTHHTARYRPSSRSMTEARFAPHVDASSTSHNSDSPCDIGEIGTRFMMCPESVYLGSLICKGASGRVKKFGSDYEFPFVPRRPRR